MPGEANPFGSPGDEVMKEHIGDAIEIGPDEIGRFRLEDDVASRSRDARMEALGIPLHSCFADADPERRSEVPVADKHVSDVVRVAGYKVRGIRLEGHKPSVSRHAATPAAAVALLAVVA